MIDPAWRKTRTGIRPPRSSHMAGTFFGVTVGPQADLWGNRPRSKKQTPSGAFVDVWRGTRLKWHTRETFVVMNTSRDILNRIKWDPDYGSGAFELSYYDRVMDKVLGTPFSTGDLEEVEADRVCFTNESSELIELPHHRLRTIRRDGTVILQRPLERKDGKTRATSRAWDTSSRP